MPPATDLEDREEAYFSRVIFICAVVTALPIFSTKYLPITDLPEHAAAISSLRHWFDPAWHVQSTYTLALGKTEYILYHLAGALLAVPFGDAALANRVLIALVAFAFPYSARALLRARGGDERLAILACVAFWSRPLRIGFLPYVASVPCVLFALALLSRNLDTPTRRRTITLILSSIAIFYIHVSGFVLFAAIALVWIALHGEAPLSWRSVLVEMPERALWLLPATLIAAVWAFHGDGPTSAAVSQIWYMPARDRLHELPLWSSDIWTTHADEACAVATWVAIGWLAALSTSAEKRTTRQQLTTWAPFLVTTVLYFALPTQVGAAASVNERMALFFPIFLILVLHPRKGSAARWPLALAAISVFATAAVATREARAASRDELGDFDSLLAHTKPGKKLVSLLFHASSDYASIGPWYQMGSYHRAQKGGVSSFSFSEIAHWPIHYLPEAAPPAHRPFWEFDPCAYRNAVDGPYFDYVLTRGALDPFRDAPPGPKWRALAHEKDWTLYEKIPGETNPAWLVEDRGPCESRHSLEAAAPESQRAGSSR
ncbi:MAG: hypothetical protein ABI183_17720 [Polyangiaceae bacterium]